MAKGFTDSSGKFHPTGNDSMLTSSMLKKVSPDGMRLHKKKFTKAQEWKALQRIVDIMYKYDLSPHQVDLATVGEEEDEDDRE